MDLEGSGCSCGHRCDIFRKYRSSFDAVSSSTPGLDGVSSDNTEPERSGLQPARRSRNLLSTGGGESFKPESLWGSSPRDQPSPLGVDVASGPMIAASHSSGEEMTSSFSRRMFGMFGFSLSTLNVIVVVIAVSLMMKAPTVSAFNVDLKTAVVHEGQENSMFGYAVAQHIDQSTNWLLIGAPRADTSQPGVIRGGAVYRCKTDRKNSCQEIPFDDTGNNIKYVQRLDTFLPIEDKSDQWFGSTIESSGENGVIVACAPRYTYFSESLDKREPVGMCYVAKTSTTKYEKYAPCLTDQWGFHRQGFCQAGFSAALSQDGRKLLVGAPGSWYWQGQLYNYETDDGGQIFSSTPEGQPDEDDSYMGYSSAIGEFDGDNNDDYVVGIPKGEQHLGKIQMYTQNMTVLGSLVGEQIGAYFGSSLAVVDLNGDRLDDIVVGAPLYAEFGSSDAFDTGRVYIFYQTSARKFKPQKRDILDGTYSKSRFGMSLSGLGDINYDGYDDLCVGAPYAGEENKGAIYIYHGSKKGIITEASQVIYAKDIDPSLKTFGISISGGWDQDNNAYPDMLVGAYASDKAVFLRTKPVVRVYASLKLQPEVINLDSKSCSLTDNTRVPCLTVYTCIEYAGVGVPDELYFDISWVLDSKENNSSVQEQRAFYTNSIKRFTETKTHKLQKKNTFCTSSYAYVKSDPADKLSPIKATLEFKLNEDGLLSRRRRDLPPILDAYIPTTTSFTAQILRDCGKDNICIPDLSVASIRVSAAHIIGSTTALEILIIVSNRGEDSFNTKLWINLPPGVAYDTISNQRSAININCGTLGSDKKLVVCDLGNPMKEGTESEFTLNLTPTNTNDTKDRLVFTLYANSSNPERSSNYENNHASVELPVTAVAEIALFGKASPELIVLNTTEQRGEERGRIVKHVFQLLNQGQSATNETEFQIRWPSYDHQGNPVLLMEGGLGIEGNGKCSIIIITPNNASGYLGWGGSSTNVILRHEDDSGKSKRNTDSQKITCTDRYCTIIQCLVGYMAPYKSFVITVQSRLKARSFIQRREETQMYHITSIAHARVRSVPYDFDSVDISKFEIKKLELVTKVNTDRLKPASKGVEMWVIILAVVAGLLFLLLLILLLWWCGFFKRKKPEEEGYFVVNGKTDIDNKIFE